MINSKKVLKYFGGGLVGIIVIWLLGSLYLTSQAANLVFLNQVSWASIPENSSLNYSLNWAKSSENKNFSIWEFSNPSSDQYLIYYHGNAGRLLHFFPSLEKKYNVISPAYHGYSESEGNPTVDNVYDVALKTYDWLVAKGIPEDKITIFGHSMGGSPAVKVASLKPNAKQLILVNTFSSIQSMCIRSYGPFCVFSGGIFNSSENGKNVAVPVSVYSYKGDTTIPFNEGEKLYDSFTNSKKKKFTAIDGYTHSYPNFDKISELQN